jgi:hypothetical protein
MVLIKHLNLKLCGRINKQGIQLCLINFDYTNKITNEIIISLKKLDQTMDYFQDREDTSQGQQHFQIIILIHLVFTFFDTLNVHLVSMMWPTL